uniref:SMP-LTD domain-containing protein n=1 Tax=Mola mola TaxID=94237 RepID=A0A3Q3WCJ9_MOLML
EIAEGLHDLAGALKTRTILDYSNYMTQLIAAQSGNPIHSPCNRDKESPRAHKKEGGSSAEGQPAWVNSLVGRIFWDFLREKYWTDQVAQKIQKKLSKIKLPYFMNELKLADLDMGALILQENLIWLCSVIHVLF